MTDHDLTLLDELVVINEAYKTAIRYDDGKIWLGDTVIYEGSSADCGLIISGMYLGWIISNRKQQLA